MADSIANNLSADAASLQLNRHQEKLAGYVRELSSGLRISDAQDDPSGLTIAENLQIHADAFTQASQNVLNARNASTVADGALATVTNILVRIRALAVEASSTITSDSDRTNLQQEIGGLLLEINRISSNTNFNGEALLDGSHAGFQAAQPASFTITANSVLATAGVANATAPSGLLVASAKTITAAQQPVIYFTIKQNVIGSPTAQTVQVNNAAYIQPGTIFSIGGKNVTIQSVNAAAGTVTAIFANNIANGVIANQFVNASLTSAVAAGTHLATLSGAQQPLYAGEILQLGFGSFATNDVVVVQQVMSTNSFIATFNKPQVAGSPVDNINGTFIGPSASPQNFTFSFGGTPTDGAAVGTPAYVIETNSGSFPPPTGANEQIVAVGTVTGGGLNSETIAFPAIPNLFGGNWEVLSGVGLGSTPIVNQRDGTIALNVVNTGASIAVQATFYDTALQQSTTYPFLIAPNASVLIDGVVVNTGDVTAQDVGLTSYIKVQQATAAVTSPNSPALSVLSGSDEGETIALHLPSVSAASLRVSTLTVMGCAANGTDATLASEDTIGQCDFALSEVLQIRAQLGGSIIRLSMDAVNDDQAKVALIASESSIRDAHTGEAQTGFMREDTEVQIGLSVLQQANQLPEQVLKLFR